MSDTQRPCPVCKIPVNGEQHTVDPDWYKFECEPCSEEWGENVKYCTPEGFDSIPN